MATRDLISGLQTTKRKKNLTFSDFDIIRLACLNLTREELRRVILFFMIGVPIILAAEQLDFLLLSGKIPKTVISAFKIILKKLIGDQLLVILLRFGFRLDIGDLDVLKRIVIRLQKLFPR